MMINQQHKPYTDNRKLIDLHKKVRELNVEIKKNELLISKQTEAKK